MQIHFFDYIINVYFVTAFDSHWLDFCANSAPAHLTVDQPYAA